MVCIVSCISYAAPREKATGKAVAVHSEKKTNEGGLESTAKDAAVARSKQGEIAAAAVARTANEAEAATKRNAKEAAAKRKAKEVATKRNAEEVATKRKAKEVAPKRKAKEVATKK